MSRIPVSANRSGLDPPVREGFVGGRETLLSHESYVTSNLSIPCLSVQWFYKVVSVLDSVRVTQPSLLWTPWTMTISPYLTHTE